MPESASSETNWRAQMKAWQERRDIKQPSRLLTKIKWANMVRQSKQNPDFDNSSR